MFPAAALAAVAIAAPAHADFSAHVTNPYYPLRPGTRWEYRGVKDGRRLRDVVTVTSRVERVAGARCAAVEDRAYLDGRLRESTIDWYSQDAHGTVWYFGEATKELDTTGRVTSTEGSWRAGVDGARQGVFMPAHPRVGQAFAQEHYTGHAEDHFAVLSLRATISVPFGTFTRRALLTRETTPLEPGVIDRKWYVRGIGEVKEATVKGGVERAELVSLKRG
jgi:hypothetical protein